MNRLLPRMLGLSARQFVRTIACCLAVAGGLVTVGCESNSAEWRSEGTTRSGPKDDIAISTFCSSCHAMPNPASFAKQRWHHEVEQGINIYRRSQRTDLVIPDFDATLAWFEQFAPEELRFEKHNPPGPSPFHPVSIPVQILDEKAEMGALSHVSVLSAAGEPPKLAAADMREGYLWVGESKEGELQMEVVGRVANPAHIEPCDLDGDGVQEFLVADLGGFFPNRSKRGSLWWFQPQPDQSWKRVPLRMGLMRVSDVRVADFDGDGDSDLVVAEFGMHFHGGIHLLTNVGMKDGVPQFESRLIDDRPGAIHLPVVDLNDDGHPDFIALISQHHEAVVAFVNRGDGTFDKETIFQAGDPAYGSSGIELADMDGDGDVDVLMSNGDTFDDQIPKPNHSIQWLENRGGFPFQHHHIGQMPGAYRAVAGDVDGDGDIDVAAVALLTENNIQEHPPGTFDGVVYFEQVDGGTFLRHRLQTDRCNSATCQLWDWDGDGDLDLVTYPYNTSVDSSDSIQLFRNDR